MAKKECRFKKALKSIAKISDCSIRQTEL
jgi:hypothetical protein